MYEGSMIGKGALFFAVWNYVCANQKPDRVIGSQVELNPKLIGFILGEPEDDVRRVITDMQQPDTASRTPDEEGRKLIKVGEYSYRVVNGVKYHDIRNEDQRREQNRAAQERFRQKHTKKHSKGKPHATAGENAFVAAENAGASESQLDSIVTASLPPCAAAPPLPEAPE